MKEIVLLSILLVAFGYFNKYMDEHFLLKHCVDTGKAEILFHSKEIECKVKE